MGKHGYRSDGRGPARADRPAYRVEPDLPRRGGFQDRPRIPIGLILGGIALWSALAFGAFVLVDPALAWFGGVVGPLADAGTGVARWFGLGQQAAALRDVANVDGLAGGLIGLVHTVAKPAIGILWAFGSLALLAAPAILSRLGGGFRTYRH